jgi:hypothetical protein
LFCQKIDWIFCGNFREKMLRSKKYLIDKTFDQNFRLKL